MSQCDLSNSLFIACRPQQVSQSQHGRLLSVNSTRMDITTKRTIKLKLNLSVIRSRSGGLRFVLPAED